MKKFMVIFLAVIMLVPTLAVATPAATDTIQIPYATTAPSIDGKGSDDAWGKAYKTTLNPSTAAKAGTYVQEKGNTSGAATADIAVLWNEKGLYFKWDVKDPTQSFALDLPTTGLNAMDGVQVVIDPFYKRFSSVKNCAFCFTFVPYTCPRGSGVGQVPTGDASWYEHWQWVGLDSSTGIQLATTLDSRDDDVDDGVDRVKLVSGYTIEVFIPVGALNLNGKDPSFKEKTNIGIGFMLMDYLYDHAKFEAAGGAEGGGAEASQVVYNFCMDFSNSKKDIGKPAKYNTAVLVKEIGDSGNIGTPYDALQNAIKLAEEYIAQKDKYTDSSIAALQAVIDEAKKLTSSASEAECTAAQTKIGTATNGLVLKENDTLKNQIEIAESIVNNNGTDNPYTAESWKVFTDALAAAKALIAKEGFSESSEEAKAAKKALEDARIALVENDGSEMADVAELEKAIDAAKKVNKADYTPASYQALVTALENAEAVYAKANTATKAEVDEATKALKDANNALVRKDASASADANTGFPWWGILLIVIGVLAIAAVVVVIVLKKKKDATQAISDGEETGSEDQDTEESVDEETSYGDQEEDSDNSSEDTQSDEENN
ncbi:MAG: hypothetical protein DBX47_04065 [Clostridiales bacterium]|nr:MAG: hypothetical protein DBX47_04065 [Clostridiales bacterium]